MTRDEFLDSVSDPNQFHADNTWFLASPEALRSLETGAPFHPGLILTCDTENQLQEKISYVPLFSHRELAEESVQKLAKDRQLIVVAIRCTSLLMIENLFAALLSIGSTHLAYDPTEIKPGVERVTTYLISAFLESVRKAKG
jgi:hypothetical protein